MEHLERSDSPLRVGVIGVGHLGAIHAKLWKGVAGAALAGVVDSDPERAKKIAAEHDTQAFAGIGELLAAVDAVSIVTPTSVHAAVAEQALQAGRHVFIEKPITARYAEAERIISMADEAGLVLQVGHIERFNPAFEALRGHSLEPMFIESHRLAQFRPRATDVAVVLDLMIHDIDLILALTRSEVTELRASGVSVVSDTIDIANARLEFASGCVANLTASRISQRQMRKMRLFQRDAYISIDFAQPSVEMFQIRDDMSGAHESTMLLGAIEQGTKQRVITFEKLPTPDTNALAEELAEFANAVRTGSQPRVTGRSGAEALRVAEEIMREIERRAVVA
ncbi:MAG: Gfo/Idh/MocA family oxidoreductase [Bacteroidetes bacterium]|nr:Gfo/Idh/MocA family oxidoreductase [Bacteroidota bacterium]